MADFDDDDKILMQFERTFSPFIGMGWEGLQPLSTHRFAVYPDGSLKAEPDNFCRRCGMTFDDFDTVLGALVETHGDSAAGQALRKLGVLCLARPRTVEQVRKLFTKARLESDGIIDG